MTGFKDSLPSWFTPQLAISAGNFLASVFTAGTIYSTMQGEAARTKQDIMDMKAEMRVLRQNDTSIAVLRADTITIKDALVRIESRVDKLQR